MGKNWKQYSYQIILILLVLCSSAFASDEAILPDDDGNTWSVGTSGLPFYNAYLSGDITLGGSLTFSDGTSMSTVPTGVEDGDKGDITVSNDGATWTIDNAVIEEANMNISNAPTNDYVLTADDGVAGGLKWAAGGGGGADIAGDLPNTIVGLTIEYASTTSVYIGAGSLVVNGSLVDVSATTHAISNFDNGGFTYLYVNGSGTISDSTTEPVSVAGTNTYYNGSLRCIGALYCDGAATIAKFISDSSENNNVTYVWSEYVQIASDMDPNGSWQSPDDKETSEVTPVNATKVSATILNADSGSLVLISIVSEEEANFGKNKYYGQVLGYGPSICKTIGDVVLGESRNIKISGEDDDNNSMSVWILGYTIRR